MDYLRTDGTFKLKQKMELRIITIVRKVHRVLAKHLVMALCDVTKGTEGLRHSLRQQQCHSEVLCSVGGFINKPNLR